MEVHMEGVAAPELLWSGKRKVTWNQVDSQLWTCVPQSTRKWAEVTQMFAGVQFLCSLVQS